MYYYSLVFRFLNFGQCVIMYILEHIFTLATLINKISFIKIKLVFQQLKKKKTKNSTDVLTISEVQFKTFLKNVYSIKYTIEIRPLSPR